MLEAEENPQVYNTLQRAMCSLGLRLQALPRHTQLRLLLCPTEFWCPLVATREAARATQGQLFLE